MIEISRIPRKQLKSSFFHVIIQGHKKEYIFRKERYIYQYIKLIRKYIKETNLTIIAYCIMQNHVHFLIQIKEDMEELSKFFHKLNTMYARYYNYMEEGRVGYVYRDRFLSEPITSHRYLIQCIKYIHFNPVKAKIVPKCEDYKFSSYRFFKKRLETRKYNSILSKEDYENICNNSNYNVSFLDIEIDQEEKIKVGIEEFLEIKNRRIYEIFSNRKILEEAIIFLKNEKHIKYVEIKKFLEMTRGTMQRIMLKNKEKK